jgi:hypothetical protein
MASAEDIHCSTGKQNRPGTKQEGTVLHHYQDNLLRQKAANNIFENQLSNTSMYR